MIGKNLKKYWILLVSLLTGFTSVFNYTFFEKYAPDVSEKHYGTYIQNEIKNELNDASKELNLIGLKYQKSTTKSFGNLSEPTKFPYFIYKNKHLIFWSDYRYIPDPKGINQEDRSSIIAQNDRISLVKKISFSDKSDQVDIYGIIPIYQEFKNENDYLKTGFNTDIFSIDPIRILNKASEKQFLNITDENGRFLFSVIPPNKAKLSTASIPSNTLILATIGLILIGIFLFFQIKDLCRQRKIGISFILILLYAVTIRWLMLANSIPFIFTESDLFNSRYFSIDRFTPSLGDLIVNSFIIVAILIFVSTFLRRSKAFRSLIKLPDILKSSFSIFLVLFSIVIAYICNVYLNNIYVKSEYLLDYSLSVNFSHLKIGTLIFYILVSAIFFLSQNIFIVIFSRLNQNRKSGFMHWLYAFILSIAVVLFLSDPNWIYALTALYFLISYFYNLPRFLDNLNYNTSIYLFIGAFIFALIAVDVIHKQELKKNLYDKQNYGQKYLAENDLLGEGLLIKVTEGIRKDSLINEALKRDKLASLAVSQIVKSKHLDLYFDKYQPEILSFDKAGMQLGEQDNLLPLNYYEGKFKKEKYRTDKPDIYFVNESGNSFIKEYAVFIPMENGHIILLLTLSDESDENVYPELLINKKYIQNPESRNYSYALFNSQNQLEFSSGNFNYQMNFHQNLIANKQLYQNGLVKSGYNHIGLRSKKGRTIVVSSEDKLLKTLISDFSFLFLLSVVMISLVVLLYGLRYGLKKLNMNFSTKIQLYLNIAFLLPLILVIIITLSVIRGTLMRVQEKSYLENTANTASTVQLHIENFKNQRMSRAYLEQEMAKLAKETNTDINYFNLDGGLDFTTRPLIYEHFLFSDKINPQAYKHLIEDKENEVLLNESLGKLKYKSVYMNIKDNNNNSLGIVSIPFFDSSENLDMQVTEVVTSILSVFILLFLLLLTLSYFASNQLTHPLKMIAQKIKRTNLDKLNEPIEWQTDDEIGVLTNSYNKMLTKLEESKMALSQSEKQTAWREMAKQVAHEIKNPLTPMKLSIQQLQRTLPSLENKTRERIERALSSLTEQIDNISEIANSFSEFAKMPVPRSEIFELVEVVEKTAYLYAQNNNVDLNVTVKDKPLIVKGDRQLMNRVVTNLIINGIQSVPPTRLPRIEISIYRNDVEKFAVIEVRDNGSGIPEEISKKVFIPNFSTKVGGTGLGLAMAKKGIEHGGGNIWFETEEDNGTVFYIDLPLAN